MSRIISRHSRPPRPTNIEFVTYLMTQSRHGALVQPFVIEAIRYYCEAILQNPEPTEHGNMMVSAIAWHRIAKETLDKMNANYETASDTEFATSTPQTILSTE